SASEQVTKGWRGGVVVRAERPLLIAVAACGYSNLVVEDLAHQPVLVIDPPRPIPLETVLQRFGLTDPFIAVTSDVLDQAIDPLQQLAVLLLPPQVVVPASRAEDDPHSSSSRSVPCPASSSSMEASSRRALAGLRSRYAVSFRDS